MTDEEYDKIREARDKMIDVVKGNKEHPLYDAMGCVCTFIMVENARRELIADLDSVLERVAEPEPEPESEPEDKEIHSFTIYELKLINESLGRQIMEFQKFQKLSWYPDIVHNPQAMDCIMLRHKINSLIERDA